MNWNQLISAKRFGMEEFHEERQENRSEFQRDYDRLIFSAPFRRLQNKTQVFPLPGSIFVHNRLTHSLEVSCVGRSLGNDVAKAILERQPELQESFLPEIGSIVSAACLAHDLGNPPFGHSGERAISTFFSEGKGQFLKDSAYTTCHQPGRCTRERTSSTWPIRLRRRLSDSGSNIAVPRCQTCRTSNSSAESGCGR